VDAKPAFNSTVLVTAAVYGIVLQLASLAGFFGLLLRFMITLSLFRYAYHVLHEVAHGRRYLTAPDIESTNPAGEISLAMHATLFVSAPVMFFLMPRIIGEGSLAELIRAVGMLVVLVAFPASVATMGMTRNIVASVNPVSIGSVIRVLRSRYLVLLASCAVVVLFAGFASAQLDRSFLASFVAEIVWVWGFLALFALVGSAIRAHSADFGFLGIDEIREKRGVDDLHDDWQRALDRAYASVRSGFLTEGYGTLKQLIAHEGGSLDVYQWVFNKMLDWENPTHAIELAQPFVLRLVAEHQHAAALVLVDQCRRLKPGFAPPPETLATLSAYARTVGRPRLADELAAVSPRAPTP